MTGNPFDHPRRRLARAQKHIDDFEHVFADLMPSQERPIIVEPNAEGTRRKFKLRLDPIPDAAEDCAVDAVSSLRAALDYAAYASAVTLGAQRPKNAYFPIAPSQAKLEADVIKRGRCNDLHPDIVALFRSFEPYKGGNGEAIWALNDLRNLAQHCSIVRTEYAGMGGKFFIPDTVSLDTVIVGGREFDPLTNEIVIMEVGPERPDTKYNFEIKILIAFPESTLWCERPVDEVLKELAGAVGSIIDATEAATERVIWRNLFLEHARSLCQS